MFNGPIARQEWFAVYLKMAQYITKQKLQITYKAVTKFCILYTEDYASKYFYIYNTRNTIPFRFKQCTVLR